MKFKVIVSSLLALLFIPPSLAENDSDREQIIARAFIVRDALEDCKVTGYIGVIIHYGDRSVLKVLPSSPDYSRMVELAYSLTKSFESGTVPVDYQRTQRLYDAEIRHAKYFCNGENYK